IIDRLNREGITTIIATHDVNALPELAERVYVLNQEIVAEGSPREIFSDWELLKKNNLEAPDVFKLFKVLTCFGYDCDTLPMSIDEAVEFLTRTIENGSGHIHLHIHKHTHEEVRKFLHSYDHH
ncbi:MAG: energy-coupling factor ABC transporter ATP-binding protein, partial [Euryarchaeota archaeon]|nr:energy-coupling factor ABC transporter ATP-binding protein [Euryarchaeota archaeon]